MNTSLFPSLFLALQNLLSISAAYTNGSEMAASKLSNIRSELVGTWELVGHVAYPLHNEIDERYPMGHDSKGIITHSPDGFMSAQFLLPGQIVLGGQNDQVQDLSAGKNFMAYAGEFYLVESDEKGPVVMHGPELQTCPICSIRYRKGL